MSEQVLNIEGLGGLQDAFRQNPAEFQAFVKGIIAATVQQTTGTTAALPVAPVMLGQVLDIYRRVSSIKRQTVKNNVNSLMIILRRTLGKSDPEKIPLTAIDKGVIFKYQEAITSEYTAGVQDEIERRQAVSRAHRTSKSTIAQARSIWCARGIDMVSRYESEGLAMPPCLEGFLTCKTRGERMKKDYVIPDNPEAVFARILQSIEVKRVLDPGVFVIFWIVIGAGLRQRELRDADWKHVIERDGKLVYQGGFGKNGRTIIVPFQESAAAVLREFRKESGPLCDYLAGRRLNFFLRSRGLSMTQKAAHELRAFVASRIFEQSPRAAQAWCRHSSLTVTEQAYSRYARRPEIPNVLGGVQ
jgi:integrase